MRCRKNCQGHPLFVTRRLEVYSEQNFLYCEDIWRAWKVWEIHGAIRTHKCIDTHRLVSSAAIRYSPKPFVGHVSNMLTKPTFFSFYISTRWHFQVSSQGRRCWKSQLYWVQWNEVVHTTLMSSSCIGLFLCIVCWGLWVLSTWQKLGPWTTALSSTLNIWLTGLWHEQEVFFFLLG